VPLPKRPERAYTVSGIQELPWRQVKGTGNDGRCEVGGLLIGNSRASLQSLALPAEFFNFRLEEFNDFVLE
jgi:hypothetical protein